MSGSTVGKAAGAGASPEQQVAEGRVRKLRSDCTVSDLQIHVAIVSHMGVLTSVALALGIHRPTLYRRIERAPQLQACLNAARAVMVSIAWEQLEKAIEAQTRWATMFVLSRQEGVPMSCSTPRKTLSVGAPEAPAMRTKATEPEAQPDVADASTPRRVLAVERGEPWAIKYCLSHLEPDGECGINRIRGRKKRSQSIEPQEEIDPEDFELAARCVEQRHGVLTSRIQLPPTPPVLEPEAVASESAQPDLAAPPVTESEPWTVAQFKMTNQPADVSPRFEQEFEDRHVDEPDAQVFRLILEREALPPVAPPVLELAQPGSPRLPFTPNQPADVSPRFGQELDERHVDEPDAQAFRLILEREALPPVAPPVLELAQPGSPGLPFTPDQPADVSPRFEQEFEDRHVDELDAQAFRLILEREALPPVAPPVLELAQPGSPRLPFTPNQPADVSPRFEQEFEDRLVDEPDAKAFRLILESEAHPQTAPPVLELAQPGSPGLPFTPDQPADVSPRFGQKLDERHVDEPDAQAFRLILEREALPPVAPPVLELEQPGSPGLPFTPDQPADVSPRFEQEFEDRHVDEPDAKAFRLILESEAHPQTAPPVTDDELDDEAGDELFPQILEMAKTFQARIAPPVSANGPIQQPDVNEFRRRLERGRARLQTAPPVEETDPTAETPSGPQKMSRTASSAGAGRRRSVSHAFRCSVHLVNESRHGHIRNQIDRPPTRGYNTRPNVSMASRMTA